MLQAATDELIQEHVLDAYDRIYRSYFRDRELLHPGQLHEVRYEDLIADPAATMERIYNGLSLGEFDAVRTKMEAYFKDVKDYRPNTTSHTQKSQQLITERWGQYLKPLGYKPRTSN